MCLINIKKRKKGKLWIQRCFITNCRPDGDLEFDLRIGRRSGQSANMAAGQSYLPTYIPPAYIYTPGCVLTQQTQDIIHIHPMLSSARRFRLYGCVVYMVYV